MEVNNKQELIEYIKQEMENERRYMSYTMVVVG